MRARDILTIDETKHDATVSWDPNPAFDAQFWQAISDMENDANGCPTSRSERPVCFIPERQPSPPKPKPIKAGWNTVKARKKKPTAGSRHAAEPAQPRKAHAVKAIQPAEPTKSKPTIATKP